MTTPEQQARELLDTKPDHLAQLLHFVEWERENNPQASRQEHVADWAYGEIVRLRAGIDAALVEINHRAKRESAQWNDMVAKGLDEAAAIVRKHTGVAK